MVNEKLSVIKIVKENLTFNIYEIYMLRQSYENSAKEFLELASNQRLHILLSLFKKKSRISLIAREIGSTNQEVSRNFERLLKSGLITKNSDGFYHLSTFGKSICLQVPSLVFLSQNKPYFEKHSLDYVPIKFMQRIGALVDGKLIKGFVKVQEIWKSIYQNSNQYIYNILPELPLEIIELAIKKASSNVEIKNVFSESMIVPDGRKKILNSNKFKVLLEKGMIERRMKNGISAAIVLNEKEAVVSFPNLDGETDLSQSFYGHSRDFHEWCLDLFRYSWYESNSFIENKLQS